MFGAADFHRRAGAGVEQHGNCQIQDQDFFSCYDCVQQCDLGALADLDTSKASVQVHSAPLVLTCSLLSQLLTHSAMLASTHRARLWCMTLP